MDETQATPEAPTLRSRLDDDLQQLRQISAQGRLNLAQKQDQLAMLSAEIEQMAHELNGVTSRIAYIEGVLKDMPEAE